MTKISFWILLPWITSFQLGKTYITKFINFPVIKFSYNVNFFSSPKHLNIRFLGQEIGGQATTKIGKGTDVNTKNLTQNVKYGK